MRKFYVCILMALVLVTMKDLSICAQEDVAYEDVYVTDDMEELEGTEVVDGDIIADVLTEEIEIAENEEIEDTDDEYEAEEIIEEAEDELGEDDANEASIKKSSKAKKKAAEEIKDKKKNKKTNASTKKSYTDEDLKLLTCLIHAEAGGQSYKGKLAVANVVLNRVKSNLYPNTIKSVIYDKKWAVQFTVTVNGALSKQLSNYKNYTTTSHKESIKAAKEALEGNNNIGSYLRFTGYSSSLANRVKKYEKIGDHIFY